MMIPHPQEKMNKDETSRIQREISVLKNQIVEKNKLEQAAVEDAEFYRSLLDKQDEFIVYWNPDGIIKYCNKGFTDLLKMPRERIVGNSFYTFIYQDDLSNLSSEVAQIYSLTPQNPAITIEYRTRSIDGQYIMQEWTHRAEFYQGELAGFFSVGRDISRSRLEDIALIEAEESYGLLFQHSLDAVLLVAQDGQIMASNIAARQMFGWTKEELDRIYWTEIVDGSDERINHVFNKWKRMEVYKGELTMMRKGGEKFPAEVSFVAFREKSGKKRISLVVRDITHRIQTEEKLKGAYNRLSSYINNSPLAVVEWDGETRLQFWSKGAERLFGWNAKEVIGKSWNEWNFIYDEDRQMVNQAVEELLVGTLDHNVVVNRNYTCDGDVVICKWHNTVLVDDASEPISILSLIHDITEQAETEQALLESEERYRSLFQNNHTIMLLIDHMTGDILDANSAACLYYGYKKDELISMNIQETIILDSNNIIEELQRSERMEKNHFVFRQNLQSGEERHVEIFSGPISINGKRLIYMIIHDITERVKVEEALRHQMFENARLLSKTSQQVKERQDILHLSSVLRVAENLKEAYPILSQVVAEILNAQGGALALLENRKLSFVASCGVWETNSNCQLSITDNIIWDFINHGEVEYYTKTAGTKENLIQETFRQFLDQIESIVFIPVLVGKSVIGLLMMGYQVSVNISLLNTPLANEISEIAGITLQRLQLVESLERLVADRTRELDTLFNVTSVARKTLKLRVSLEGALEQIQKVMDNLASAIYLINETSLNLELFIHFGMPAQIQKAFSTQPTEIHPNVWVLKNGEPLFLPDLAANKNFPITDTLNAKYAFLGVPLRVGGQVVGVLDVIRGIDRAFNIEEMTLISAIADHLGLIVENVRLHKQAEQAAIMEERARLARDLHDSATQYLYSINLYTEAGRALFEKGEYKQVHHYLDRLADISHQALKEIRLLVYELRPPVLDEDGIIGALKKRLDAVEGRARVHATLLSENIIFLPKVVEAGLYKIASEALNNILKYAEASEVKVHIYQDGEEIVLTVEDNGKGFDLEKASLQGGMGLSNMQERTEKLGGVFNIKTDHKSGTTVTARVPLPVPVQIEPMNGDRTGD